ncbi:MAG: hypothetical protein ACI4FY_06250 [Acetatifactor sp.]
MSIYHLDLPATDEWKKLKKERETDKHKSVQDYDGEEISIEELKVLYKLSEDGKCAILYDLYEDNMEFYGDGITVPFSSVYQGKIERPAGTRFKNIVGTSLHKLSGESWICAYDRVTNMFTLACCSDGNTYINNYIYKQNICNNKFCECHKFRHNLVGAHVYVQGVDNSCYAGIVPLCDCHNKQNDCYMKFIRNTLVMLIDYKINQNVYQSYIDKIEGEVKNE